MNNRIKEIQSRLHAVSNGLGQPDAIDIEESRRWAEALRRGRIFFYNTQEVEIGLRDIDWTGSHIAHQEWQAQLNRFFALPHLVNVYAATGDSDLPELARRLIEDWIDQHTYDATHPPAEGDNTLNLSIRLGQSRRHGWWATVPEFADSGVFDDDFVQRMIDSSRGQLDCLHAHLSGQGNWRISQLDCMLFCGLVVPELDAYMTFAARNLNETFHRQVNEDGSHEEHNPSYHGWMCDVFTDYWRLGCTHPELGLQIDPERVVRMWDYRLASTAPDGGSAGLHDGSVWKPGPGRIGAMEARRRVIAETQTSRLAWDPEASPSRYFEQAGQVFVRDSWKPDATMLSFDATRWGGGHCHLSRNSINLYAGSRMLLCDPGVFSYEMTDPFAAHGKSTPAHNTINLAGMSQSEADPHTPDVHLFKDAAIACSIYEGGYWPGLYTWGWYEGKRPGVFAGHGRALLWLADRGVIVWDTVKLDREGQPYAAHWQFPAGTAQTDTVRQQAWTCGDDDNILVRVLHSEDTVDMSIREGQRVPERGWLPAGGPGAYQPAPQLTVEAIAHGRCPTLATLLLPFKGATPPDVNTTSFTDRTGRCMGFVLQWDERHTDIVSATPNLLYQVGESQRLVSDGALACVSLRDDKPYRAILVNGLYLDFDGETLIAEARPGTYRVSLPTEPVNH